MSALEIATTIISVLMVASRFLDAAKPIWNYLPKPVAVLLPAIVMVIPQATAMLGATKTSVDLVTNLIGVAGLVVVGLFPKDAPTPPSA